jgi:hypothetical protein
MHVSNAASYPGEGRLDDAPRHGTAALDLLPHDQGARGTPATAHGRGGRDATLDPVRRAPAP